MPDPLDAVRAEGRRLRELIRTERTAGEVEAARQAVKDFCWLMLAYADVLLAAPAPVPDKLSEKERGIVEAEHV